MILTLINEGLNICLSEFIFDQFKRHGYSKDEVLSLVKENRIWTAEGNTWAAFNIDDEPLFEIIIMSEKSDDDSEHRELTFKCIDYKEVK